jgi:protein-S-isoprenylcysteine O-methyltransferase Ste14
LFAGVTLLPLLALPALLPDRGIYRIPFPWVLLSTFFQLIAAAALGIGLLQTGLWSFLGVQQLFVPIENHPPVLVVHGLYRWVRHPLYTAGLVFIWLIPVMTVNLLAFNLGLSGYILIGAIFEERKLLREYGMAYAEYQARTPMLVPGLRWRAKLDAWGESD